MIGGLEKLEYRGYDSAGISINDGNGIKIAKALGRLAMLEGITDGGRKLRGTAGLGHTRWATHGRPSDANSHPHLSQTGRIAVVHNGIIENYRVLKEMLINRGRVFVSETDTEVATQLIDFYYEGDLLRAVHRAMNDIEGAYALGIMCADDPDTLIAVRKQAPLIVAYGEGENYFASDVTAVLEHTKRVSYLSDGEIAVLTPGEVKFYDSFLQPVEKQVEIIDWDVSAAEKGGYEHFMIKEILEQPRALRDTVSPRIRDGKIVFEGIELDADYIRGIDWIYIVACGSSYHVGVVAKYNIERIVRKPVQVVLASEFRYSEPLVTGNTLAIMISQSGETADTIAALREAKRLGARTLAIVNVVGSTIAREADDVLYTWAGPEIAVATTKAYSTQLAVTYLLTLYFAECCGRITESELAAYLEELNRIPDKLEEICSKREHVQYLASLYFSADNIFFIGRNIDYALSLEGSLKLKEISYICSEAYAAGELKHGTISLIEDDTPVVAVMTSRRLMEKTASNAEEVKARGARVLAVTTESLREEAERVADNVIAIPDSSDMFLPSLAIVPMQLFSYYVAVSRGCNIDKPRNLAKSVTVE